MSPLGVFAQAAVPVLLVLGWIGVMVKVAEAMPR